MRQLAGGLRERDVEQFAIELGSLARRNPGVFLAGSVALGFGVARFFKASAPRHQRDRHGGRYRADVDERSERADLDGDEGLDLSQNPAGFAARGAREGAERELERAPPRRDENTAPPAIEGATTVATDDDPVHGGKTP
jgi:hypothetical protein